MKQKFYLSLIIITFLLFCYSIFADWEQIISGFDYQKFTISGPVEVFVTRMYCGDDIARQTNVIDSCIAQGQFYKVGLVNGGREVVSSMANRYDEEINFYYQSWGKRNNVVAAINGDYWEREYYPSGPYTGCPAGGQIISGWFARRFPEYGGGSGFVYTIWGYPRLGGDVRNGDVDIVHQLVIFQDASESNITNLNKERDSDDLMLYTPQWASSTHTDNSGVEVLVQVNRPNLLIPDGVSANSCTGTIIEIRDGVGNTLIPFDHIVLSGTGTGATTLRNKCVVGQTLYLRMHLRDYGFPDRTPPHPPQDWTKAYGVCGVDREVLIDSQITNLPSPDATRDPRTAVALHAIPSDPQHLSDYVYFLVADGRRAGSIGMTFGELAAFCRDYLGATHAASLDGGGSSTLWVNGQVKNIPSDLGNVERATTNGLLMVQMLPKQQSIAFPSDQKVKTIVSTPLRLGPSTNYASIATIPIDTEGQIVSHSLNGTFAKGEYWWKCQFGSNTGWIPGDQLVSTTSAKTWKEY